MAELSTIARPYAEALFSVAQGTGESLEGWRAAVDELAGLMSHPQVADVVADPNLDHAQVFGLLTGMMKASLPAAGTTTEPSRPVPSRSRGPSRRARPRP